MQYRSAYFKKIMCAFFSNSAVAQGTGVAPGVFILTSGSVEVADNYSSGASLGQQTAGGANVDVAAIVEKAAAGRCEKLNSKTSIVELMKALNINFGLYTLRVCEGARL